MMTYNLVFCVAIKCSDLAPPQYGKVVVRGYTHGSKAQYSCNKGYKLYGDDYNTCDYGRWIKRGPICKREFYFWFNIYISPNGMLWVSPHIQFQYYLLQQFYALTSKYQNMLLLVWKDTLMDLKLDTPVVMDTNCTERSM